MISNDTEIFVLPNGLRCVCRRQSDSLVSYIGVLVNAGSRDEDKESYGLAHFVEHTIFKGTDRRSSSRISSRMESVGGELNAYTSKEETMVYTNAPAGYEERAIELLADLIANSRFPREEVEREREVIVEEIHSYLDSPADAVYDEFEELAYAGSGLAHNILGSADGVRKLKSEDCRGFLDKFYTPGEMVVYCNTPHAPAKMGKLVEKYFRSLHLPDTPRKRETPPQMIPFDERRDKGNHQDNTITGARLFGRTDNRRFPLFLLNNHLGGPCMNSVLNRELREKRGLVYTVDSSVSLMTDTGLILIYFGCDPSNVGRCRRIIARELDRLAQSPLGHTAFENIKRQYCGQLLVSTDHRESRAMALAKSLMYFGEIHDPATTAERIRAVTAEEMRSVAEEVAKGLLGTLTLT